ncbi:MAG: DUF1722 domain-containing protein [Clostridiales bacterium]|nr:DUF1722 domain-containing protein [Clostridiales bacterium]
MRTRPFVGCLSKNQPVDPLDFYSLTEGALYLPIKPGQAENAALHIWGYLSDRATEREKKVFFDRLNAYRSRKGSLSALKKHLFRLAEKYDETYLLNSLYFYLQES